jgi:hypothetical protein
VSVRNRVAGAAARRAGAEPRAWVAGDAGGAARVATETAATSASLGWPSA